MSDYIDKLLSRADLESIREHLLDGTGDEYRIDKRPYEQRLDEDCAAIYRHVEAAYPDGDERDAVSADIYRAITAYQEVFFELGLKCGARMLRQLLA